MKIIFTKNVDKRYEYGSEFFEQYVEIHFDENKYNKDDLVEFFKFNDFGVDEIEKNDVNETYILYETTQIYEDFETGEQSENTKQEEFFDLDEFLQSKFYANLDESIKLIRKQEQDRQKSFIQNVKNIFKKGVEKVVNSYKSYVKDVVKIKEFALNVFKRKAKKVKDERLKKLEEIERKVDEFGEIGRILQEELEELLRERELRIKEELKEDKEREKVKKIIKKLRKIFNEKDNENDNDWEIGR